MRINIITMFPEIFEAYRGIGPIRNALDKKILELNPVDLKQYAPGPKEVDDYPYGGGSGMVIKAEPILAALSSIKEKGKIILTSPQGKKFDQELAFKLAKEPTLTILCGRYKGIDERIIHHIDMEISVGDYILSGGEPAALIIIDTVVRLLEGALGDVSSCLTDSIISGILDAPYYTRPRELNGIKVPSVLLSGNHEEVRKWRRKEALKRTLIKRPDLLRYADLTEEDINILKEIEREVYNG
ncbi:MAG: tRNA (guanosine(37)-N1)-methyltransferase TrmD [Candidatus Hydrothermae bacterium]|nr:tRNA (guanosine(37)-N1)-methyltransferase TrmD [Candidatus Hydrothermae bacterium]